jgi:transcriptional regulator with XRE-family HTH domain
MTTYKTALGYAIRTQRLSKKMTLRQTGKKAHMAISYISEVERGHKDISSELLECLISAIGISLGELITNVASIIVEWESQEQEKNIMTQLDKDRVRVYA